MQLYDKEPEIGSKEPRIKGKEPGKIKNIFLFLAKLFQPGLFYKIWLLILGPLLSIFRFPRPYLL